MMTVDAGKLHRLNSGRFVVFFFALLEMTSGVLVDVTRVLILGIFFLKI